MIDVKFFYVILKKGGKDMKKLWNFNLNFVIEVGKHCFTLFFECSPSSQVWLVCKICSTLLNLATGHWKSVLSANTIWSDLSSLPFYESWASCLEHSQLGQILLKKCHIWIISQRYTYRVLQTIQMKPILLCVWAERAILGSAKTAWKLKYEI